MYCARCGSVVSEDSCFCSKCGSPAGASSGSERGKKKIDGVVHKCPQCGQPLDAFVTKCPSCGYELRDIDATYVVCKMSEKLLAARGADERVNIIRSFPIPNTKEDVVEFFAWAASNVNPRAYGPFSNSDEEAESDAWEAKLDQSYTKAQILFGHEKEFSEIEAKYKETKKKVSHAKGGMARFWIAFTALVILGWAALFAMKACGMF